MKCLFSDTRSTSEERNSAGAPGKRAGDAHTGLGLCVCWWRWGGLKSKQRSN